MHGGTVEQPTYGRHLDRPGRGGAIINAVDITGAENNISLYEDGSAVIENSYLHNPQTSVSGNHVDNIEVYDGANVVIKSNNITSPASSDVASEINIAPWGDRRVSGLSITDNFIDGGHPHIIYDSTQGRGVSGCRCCAT